MRLVTAIVVLVTWVGVWGRVTTAVLVTGALLALPALLRRDAPGWLTFRPLAAARAVVVLTAMLLRSNLTVVHEVLRSRHPVPEGIVDVHLRRAPQGLDVLVASAVTLTPGTAVLDLDREADGTILRVHTLRLDDAAKLERDVLRLESLAVAALVRASDRGASP